MTDLGAQKRYRSGCGSTILIVKLYHLVEELFVYRHLTVGLQVTSPWSNPHLGRILLVEVSTHFTK
jgi:hypothetical protein